MDSVVRPLRSAPRGLLFMRHAAWRDALFLHWRVDANELQRHLPHGLCVDVHSDGYAYVGVVALTECGIAPWVAAPVAAYAGLQHHALNVRTYVRAGADDVPGVYFFTLDCTSTAAALGATALFTLPYRLAVADRTAVTRSTDTAAAAAAAVAAAAGAQRQREEHHTFRCDALTVAAGTSAVCDGVLAYYVRGARVADAPSFAAAWTTTTPSPPSSSLSAAASPTAAAATATSAAVSTRARPGSLDYFLVERYCLYVVGNDGFVYRGSITHEPWPLRRSDTAAATCASAAAASVVLHKFDSTMVRAVLPTTVVDECAPPHSVLFSPGVRDVDFYSFVSVGGGACDSAAPIACAE